MKNPNVAAEPPDDDDHVWDPPNGNNGDGGGIHRPNKAPRSQFPGGDAFGAGVSSILDKIKGLITKITGR
jgi:hypothetical protein